MNAEQILAVLDKQKFADWYAGDFISYVSGDEDCPSKADILNKIRQLFKCE